MPFHIFFARSHGMRNSLANKCSFPNSEMNSVCARGRGGGGIIRGKRFTFNLRVNIFRGPSLVGADKNVGFQVSESSRAALPAGASARRQFRGRFHVIYVPYRILIKSRVESAP